MSAQSSVDETSSASRRNREQGAEMDILTHACREIRYMLYGMHVLVQTSRPCPDISDDSFPKTLTTLAHAKIEKQFTFPTRHLPVLRSSMALPECKAWILSRPTRAFGTYIPHREFRAWLQVHFQVPLFEPSTRCPR